MRAMLRFFSPFIVLFITAPLSAQETTEPAFKTETILALKGLQLLDQRMNAVGYRLVSRNTQFCKTKAARAGLLLHDVNQYADQAAARFALGFNGPVSINAVAPGGTGFAGGLVAGDDIVAINGIPVQEISLNDPAVMKELPEYRLIAAINQTLEVALSQSAVAFDILRGGQKRLVTIEPEKTCPGRFQIQVSSNRSASADGKMVTVSSKLAEYFIGDDEFAAVVAHELAHNLLKHKERLNAQKVNRGFFGQFGKSSKRVKQTEIEADRLSIWLMANAGYDPQAAIRFWTRYGKEHGKGIFSASTHYRWKKRVKLFEEEIAKMGTMEPKHGKFAPPLLAGSQ